jgi:hypothetical protein
MTVDAPAPGSRKTLYHSLRKAADRLTPLLNGNVVIEDEMDLRLVPEGARDAAVAVLEATRLLTATMPLEVDADAQIREVLKLEMGGHSGRAWGVVRNDIGKREFVTTVSLHRNGYESFENWCRCREEGVPAMSSWDEACRERRVVLYHGENALIDRGAIRIVDLVTSTGCQTTYSCEGHPRGGYLVFSGSRAEELGAVFRTARWIVESRFPDDGDVVIRMPKVKDVGERDDQWRRICDTVERHLAGDDQRSMRSVRNDPSRYEEPYFVIDID